MTLTETISFQMEPSQPSDNLTLISVRCYYKQGKLPKDTTLAIAIGDGFYLLMGKLVLQMGQISTAGSKETRVSE